MQSVAIHGAGAADTFSAGASEGKGGVKIVFDVNECIEIHWRDLFEVDIVTDIFGFILRILRVVFVDEKTFHLCFLLGREGGVMFDDIVRVEVTFDCRGNAFKED